ncbi:MAG: 3-deoxy-7-phosphoheptulonate synthase [Firmicutes bacterium HGW-Firmicutes-15]|nr:MAG: 3-deoxy-7-phosphoheptulonate synthase [Firmicutes bacterium HGW-Firmicutes-15]
MEALKLASREKQSPYTVVEIDSPQGPVRIGEGYCTVIAGPCAVENREEYLLIAQVLKEMGVHILRGGAFKPRSSPYSFMGLGVEGLKILAEARELTGLPVVTEVMDTRDIELISSYADILQVGSRNMQNFSLLQAVGRINKPVILKRGLSATIEEWLLAAEYILSAGNQKLILCERGIRTFESYTRNTLDIGAVVAVKELSHLPIIVDPSHATGRWKMVRPASKAAMVAGADGLMVEVHPYPERALSDGKQSLNPDNFARLWTEVKQLADIEGKHY